MSTVLESPSLQKQQNITIRQATESDVPTILEFIQDLAVYEKLSHEVVATEDGLREHLFGDMPKANVVFICLDDQPVGFALFFYSFSTFLGKPGLYLEDLYIRKTHRGQGLGGKLLCHLAKLAVEGDYGRMEWAVLNWNTPAIKVYDSLNATPMSEWTTYRLTGDSLAALAQKEA